LKPTIVDPDTNRPRQYAIAA